MRILMLSEQMEGTWKLIIGKPTSLTDDVGENQQISNILTSNCPNRQLFELPQCNAESSSQSDSTLGEDAMMCGLLIA
jgi:hypothetical protein